MFKQPHTGEINREINLWKRLNTFLFLCCSYYEHLIISKHKLHGWGDVECIKCNGRKTKREKTNL